MFCGIDEAGRGCVIGPLVIAGVKADRAAILKLKEMGVKDSKLLTRQKREELYESIIKMVEWHAEVIHPEVIDAALRHPTNNLNWLEADNTAVIIDRLTPKKAIVDCPSVNTSAYRDYLISKVKSDVDIVAKHKADRTHTIVGAASIIAKVIRDRKIDTIKIDVNHDFGSGYMSDEKTSKFLENAYETHKKIFRQTWSSYKRVADKKNQSRIGDFK